jgi:hypothetical protein
MCGMIGIIIPSGIYIKLPHGNSVFNYLIIRAHISALICSVSICCTKTSPASKPKITWHGSNWLWGTKSCLNLWQSKIQRRSKGQTCNKQTVPTFWTQVRGLNQCTVFLTTLWSDEAHSRNWYLFYEILSWKKMGWPVSEVLAFETSTDCFHC